MAKGVKKAFERVEVTSRAGLRRWFEQNHQRAESVWLIVWKKRAGAPHVPYDDIVEECLAFGWVDSRPEKLDDARSMLLLSPRRSGSAWSATNKARVEKLLSAGLMTRAGLAKIEAAKKDGSWTFLDDIDVTPSDLSHALRSLPGAKANFEAFPASTRRGILEWIKTAKKPETRAARIAETARLAAENVRANTPRQPKSATAARMRRPPAKART